MTVPLLGRTGILLTLKVTAIFWRKSLWDTFGTLCIYPFTLAFLLFSLFSHHLRQSVTQPFLTYSANFVSKSR